MRSPFLFLLAVLVSLAGCRPAADPVTDTTAPPAEPVAAVEAPRPDAAYVGDAACASCHADIVEAYGRTNHKRALTAFDPATAPERFDGPKVVHNEPTNLSYEAFVRGDSLYQREFRLDVNGDTIHQLVFAADYVIGSGNATRSYLMSVNGFVTEMPLTWYIERAQWDMSPGYAVANDRFSRKINLQCMTCHNGLPEHSAFTQNHYPEVPLGITCERCHGPAGDHVAARQAGTAPAPGAPDPDIVNPARLERGARMANCQQCHLAGVTVFRTGHDPTTFLPGMELVENRTVYVPEEHLVDPDWVGIDSHPLRLARSACYQATDMTCTTCHDPHVAGQELPENYYNDACLSCHNDEAGVASSHLCTRPGVDAGAGAMTGDCVSCHMQKGGTSDIPHVSFSDHWIRKDPGPPRDPDDARTFIDSPDPIRLVALQQEGRPSQILEARTTQTPLERLETAIAYFTFYEQFQGVPAYVRTAIDEVRRGRAGGADHLEARIALGRALANLDSLEAAEVVLREAAAAYPDDAWVYFWLGSVQDEKGDTEEALAALRRSVEIQPLLMESQVKLADALYRAGRTDEAIARLEEGVRIDPIHVPRSWYNLGLLYLGQRRTEDAERALTRAAELDPNLVDAHVQLGTLFMARQALDRAERSFRSAIEAGPEDPAGYGSLGLLFLQQGDVERARQLFQVVLQIDPTNQAARTMLSRLQ